MCCILTFSFKALLDPALYKEMVKLPTLGHPFSVHTQSGWHDHAFLLQDDKELGYCAV